MISGQAPAGAVERAGLQAFFRPCRGCVFSGRDRTAEAVGCSPSPHRGWGRPAADFQTNSDNGPPPNVSFGRRGRVARQRRGLRRPSGALGRLPQRGRATALQNADALTNSPPHEQNPGLRTGRTENLPRRRKSFNSNHTMRNQRPALPMTGQTPVWPNVCSPHANRARQTR
jgi:hypothetical protein